MYVLPYSDGITREMSFAINLTSLIYCFTFKTFRRRHIVPFIRSAEYQRHLFDHLLNKQTLPVEVIPPV